MMEYLEINVCIKTLFYDKTSLNFFYILKKKE